MYTTWTFDGIENKYHVFRDENCTKRFFESFREHEMKIIHLEKKKMIPLTNKKYASYLNEINSHIRKNPLSINTLKIQIVVNSNIIVIVRANTEVLHIAYII